MTDLIFYEKVVSIDSTLHQNVRIKPVDSYHFCAKTNSVPLVAVEFIEAAREYPIAFIKSTDGSFLPIALLGLRDNENLCVSREGKWLGRYIPAFVRRYPFVPAELGQGQMVVCFDEAASVVSQDQGEPLFEADKPGPLLNKMLALLQDYQAQAVRTKELCKRLSDCDLLVESNVQAEIAGGANFRLTGLFVVDEKKLQDLHDDQVQAIFRTGELGLVYAHLMSLGNLQRLLERLGAQAAA